MTTCHVVASNEVTKKHLYIKRITKFFIHIVHLISLKMQLFLIQFLYMCHYFYFCCNWCGAILMNRKRLQKILQTIQSKYISHLWSFCINFSVHYMFTTIINFLMQYGRISAKVCNILSLSLGQYIYFLWYVF